MDENALKKLLGLLPQEQEEPVQEAMAGSPPATDQEAQIPTPNGGLVDSAADALGEKELALQKAQMQSKTTDSKDVADEEMPSEKERTPAEAQVEKELGVDTQSEDDSTDDDDQEDDSEEAPQSEADMLRAKLAKLSGKTPVESKMNTKDALIALLGQNQEDLKAAQAERDRRRFIALMNDAGNTIGRGLTPMARHEDTSGFTKQLLDNANLPVQDIMTKQAVARQGLQDQMAQQQAAKQLAYQDPNSLESQTFRNALAQIPGLKAAYGDQWDTISAANKDLVFDPIKMKEQNQLRRDMAAQNAFMRQTMVGNKESEQDKKRLTHVIDQLSSLRGDSAAQKAGEALRRGAQAQKLLNQTSEKLDSLDPRMVQLGVNEVAAISTGGVPGHSEIMALAPPDTRAKLSNLISTFTNKPTPQNAGAFLKQYNNYLTELNHVNKDVLFNRAKRIVGMNSTLLSQDQTDDLLKKATDPDMYNYGGAGDVPVEKGPGLASTTQSSVAPGEITRITKDGKVAIFDGNTKKFLRYQ